MSTSLANCRDTPLRKANFAAILAPIILAASGCGDSSERGDSASFASTDSAGIRIAVTPGPAARAALDWEVDSVPDVVIGNSDSPGGYLHRVQGMAGLPDGGFVVVDGGSAELRFFDSAGRFVDRAGGQGEGPGEFRDPVLVPSIGFDSLLMFDKGLARFQVFSIDGRDHRTIPRADGRPIPRSTPLGAVGSGVLVTRGGLVDELSLMEMGLKHSTTQYNWYDSAAGREIELPGPHVIDWTYRTRTNTLRAIPFTSRPAAAVTDSSALVSNGRTSEIREYDVEGRLLRIVRVDEPPRLVDSDMIEEALERESASASESAAARRKSEYAELPIPDTMPVFQSLEVDEIGWVWAELYEANAEGPTEWMVFDPEGRARGIVATPSGLEVQWIGRDYILGVWRDALDVEFVRRHALRRRPSTANTPD